MAVGVELRHRQIKGLRIALDLGLVWLANIDQQDHAFCDAACDLLRLQIVHVLGELLDMPAAP